MTSKLDNNVRSICFRIENEKLFDFPLKFETKEREAKWEREVRVGWGGGNKNGGYSNGNASGRGFESLQI